MKNNILLYSTITCITLFIAYFFLSWREESVVSILIILALVLAIVIYVVFHEVTFFVAMVIIANNVSNNRGAPIAIFLLMGIVLVLLPFAIANSKPTNIRSFTISILLFTFYYAMIFLIRPYSINGNWVLLHFETFLFFILAQTIKWDTKKIISVVTIHFSFLLIYGFFEHLIRHIDRLAGPMQSATGFGVLLAIVWSIWVSDALFKKKPNWILILSLTILSILEMIWTGTRMTLIGVVVATFVISLILFLRTSYSAPIKTTMIIVLPFLLLIVFSVIWQLIPNDVGVKQSFSTILQGKIDPSNMGRIIGWYGGWQAFVNNPIFGVGNGNFLSFLQGFLEKKNIDLTSIGVPLVPHAHNLFLIILSENGLFGFMCIFTVVLIGFVNYFKFLMATKNKEFYCLLIGSFVLVTLGLFDSVPFFPPTEAWGAWFIAVLLQLSPVNMIELEKKLRIGIEHKIFDVKKLPE